MKAAGKADQARKRQLAKIHILKGELKLDRDSYENILHVIQAGCSSAGKLDEHGRGRLIDMLVERKEIVRRGVAAYPGRPRNADVETRQELLKIEALLTDAGLPWNYAQAVLKQQTRGRKTKFEFADGFELASVVAALEKTALKRLAKELEAELGKPNGRGWNPEAIAILGFGFPRTWSLEKNTQAMSKVLRWLRGELAATCAWPATKESLLHCCPRCAARFLDLQISRQ